mgnify:CR=1 FL=1
MFKINTDILEKKNVEFNTMEKNILLNNITTKYLK